MRQAAFFCIVVISIVITLIYGQNLILPFILGILFWFIMRSLKKTLNKIEIVKKYIPSWVNSVLSSIIILFFLIGLFELISVNITNLSQSYEQYQSNIGVVIKSINETFNLNIVETFQKQMGDFDFGNLLGSVFSSLSDLISNTFMIILYSLFIFLEEVNFDQKLKAVFPKKKRYSEILKILGEIENSVSNYFRLKAIVSLITGGLSFLALWMIGVESPIFWAFLIFLFNFIPTIGSLIGTIFPAVFALLQYGELSPFFLVLIIVGIIQVIVGNILEPRLMGSTMNISPLVTILALSIWGAIWGVMGMILSVPITVIMIIVFSHFENTKSIAILLSEKGELSAS